MVASVQNVVKSEIRNMKFQPIAEYVQSAVKHLVMMYMTGRKIVTNVQHAGKPEKINTRG
jgi:hypothetical protein